MTPLEKQMKEEADLAEVEDEKTEASIRKVLETEGFFKRLRPYNKPLINVVIGVCVSVI